MFEWSEEQLMVRDTIRRFIEAEVVPHIDELEHGDLPGLAALRGAINAPGQSPGPVRGSHTS